jgi:uncharacterized protein
MQDETTKYGVWIIVATIIALGIIIPSFIITGGIINYRESQNAIEVVGSAKKQIRSDLVSWTGTFSAQSKKMPDAYAQIKKDGDRVKKYLVMRGIPEKDIVFSSITTSTHFVILQNGTQTNQIESYQLSQSVEIRSGDVDKITDISRKATELINEGIEFQSGSPQYYYTKIADLKIEVLSLASRDARIRADRIAENTGCRIGRLATATQGVFQITPLYSTEVSDRGMYDTTSIDKEITAIVICRFVVRR